MREYCFLSAAANREFHLAATEGVCVCQTGGLESRGCSPADGSPRAFNLRCHTLLPPLWRSRVSRRGLAGVRPAERSGSGPARRVFVISELWPRAAGGPANVHLKTSYRSPRRRRRWDSFPLFSELLQLFLSSSASIHHPESPNWLASIAASAAFCSDSRR